MRDENETFFIDDGTGEILGQEDFIAFDTQLESIYEKDFIWGYQNLTYDEGNFYSDTGYFSAQEDKFVVVKEQFERKRLLWVSEDHVLFLKKGEITFYSLK